MCREAEDELVIVINKNGKLTARPRKPKQKKVENEQSNNGILRTVGFDTDDPDHPERKAKEHFFGNMTDSCFDKLPWTSKRQGKVVYTKEGKKLNTSLKPIFVSEEDYRLAHESELPDSLVA